LFAEKQAKKQQNTENSAHAKIAKTVLFKIRVVKTAERAPPPEEVAVREMCCGYNAEKVDFCDGG